MVAYDWIGGSQRATRQPDPRIASQVHAALSMIATASNRTDHRTQLLVTKSC
jgi:hypothetical protein